MIKKILFLLLFALPIQAETKTVYLTYCNDPTDKVELGWFIPVTRLGTHNKTADGWLDTTPLGVTYENFIKLFQSGKYDLIYDLDADEFILPNDWNLLIERWETQPTIWGNMQRLPNGIDVFFPQKACVRFVYSSPLDPLQNLYNACFASTGEIRELGPNGEEWRGPTIAGPQAPCEGGTYNQDGTVYVPLPPPPAPSSAAITGLALWDAITDTVLDPDFTNGDTISSSCVSIEIKANAYVQANGSVGKVLDNGSMLCENYFPYAWEDDAGVGQFNCAPSLSADHKGSHILTVIPFEGKGCTGPAGPPVNTSFTIN